MPGTPLKFANASRSLRNARARNRPADRRAGISLPGHTPFCPQDESLELPHNLLNVRSFPQAGSKMTAHSALWRERYVVVRVCGSPAG